MLLRSWEFLLLRIFRSTNCSSKKHKTRKRALWSARKLHRIVWNSKDFDYCELINDVSKDVKIECFAKRTENCKTRSTSVDKDVKDLEGRICLKIRTLVDSKAGEGKLICSSYPFTHKTTLDGAENKAKLVLLSNAAFEVVYFVLWNVLFVHA